ncbi:MAG: hypothetical protein AAGE65_14575 [Planctomycetota bacterium]
MPNPHTDPATDPSQVANPDAAVDLLSDLEDRLGALRSWQSQSEAQAEKVREHSRNLEQRQQDLDEQTKQLDHDRAEHAKAVAALQDERADAEVSRQQLDADLAELDRAQTALDDRKRDLEAHAVEVEEELAGKHRHLEAEESRRLGEVVEIEAAAEEKRSEAQARLEEAQARQAELDQKFADLTDAQAKLDEAQELLADRVAQADERDARLDARQVELQDVANKLEAERAKLDERASDLEARARDLDRVSDELDAEMTRLTARQAELDAASQRLDEQRGALEGDREAYRQAKLEQDLRAEELEAREAALAKSRQKLLEDAAAGQLDEQTQQQREDELAKQAGELASLREAHDAAVAELEAARTEAETQRDASANARTELEAAQHELEGAQTLIAQREAELTGLRDELDARVEELAQLRRQLDPADDADDQASLPTFAFAATEESTEIGEPAPGLEKLQALVEEREIEIADLRSQLEAQAQELQEARTRADDLETQLEAALAQQQDATPDADVSDDPEFADRLAALTETLTQRDEQLEDTKHDLDARTAEVQLLRERIESLTQQLEAGGGSTSELADLDDEEAQRRRNELDEQAAQVAADRQRVLERKAQLKQADEIIKQRREKIRQYIKLAKQQALNAGVAASADEAPAASPIAASDAARLAGLDKERAALAEVKLFLEQSEAAMVRRWATNKAGSLVTSTVIAVILAVGFSFFVGSQLATPVYRATMAVEIQPEGDAAELPPGAWLTDYKRTLLSAPVLAEALNQMDQQGVRVASTPEQLEAHLRTNLVATGGPERVELAYHGQDTAQIGTVLEAYGRGLLVHHMSEDRRAGRLTDTARVLQPAVAESTPLQDDRLKYALATFAAIFAAAALLALPLRLLYGRSQRVLHEDFMPQLAMLNESDTEQAASVAEEEAFVDEATSGGVRNDGPPVGFARIPDHVDDDEDEVEAEAADRTDEDEPGEDDQPEQVFRF